MRRVLHALEKERHDITTGHERLHVGSYTLYQAAEEVEGDDHEILLRGHREELRVHLRRLDHVNGLFDETQAPSEYRLAIRQKPALKSRGDRRQTLWGGGREEIRGGVGPRPLVNGVYLE